jgi:hypothetical protein
MCAAYDSYHSARSDLLVMHAVLLHQLIKFRVVIASLVKLDRDAYFNKHAVDAAKASEVNDTRTVFKFVKLLASKSVRSVPILKNKHGELVRSPAQRASRWLEFFSSKCFGSEVVLDTLAIQSAELQKDKFFKLCSVGPDLDLVMSLHEAASLCAIGKPRRAFGLDGLPAELFALQPLLFAKLLHPLYLKSILRIEEPLQWKGGLISNLYKGKGDRSECSSSRDILISDSAGKKLHSFYRKRLLPSFLRSARPTMCGGVPHRGTDYASHLARSFVQYCSVNTLSCSLLFVDVVSAFAGIVKALVFQDDVSDYTIACIFKTYGFGPDHMHRLSSIVSGGTFLSKSGASGHLELVISDAHSCNWFTVQGSDRNASLVTGSRAGDPLGDIIFNYIEISLVARA